MAQTKWFVLSSCAAALLTTASVHAQQAPRTTVSREKVTVAGCITRDSAAKPTWAVRSGSGEFLLVPRAGQDRSLDRYVGRHVEIVGTIEPPRDVQQPTGGATDPVSGAGVPPGAPASQRATAPATTGVQTLNVLSVKSTRGGC
jgi:hypothetical protein